jgi:hypothetical protein
MKKPSKDDVAGFLSGRNEKFYFMLGHFIARYADAEGLALACLRKLSGLSETRARIIFGGMRLDDISEKLRKITRAARIPRDVKTEILSCIDQLAKLQRERAKLVHRSIRYHGEGIFAHHTAIISKSRTAHESENITADDLHWMAIDAMRIGMRLIKIMRPENEFGFPERSVLGPWFYIPPSQESRKERTREARQPPRPPRRSSREKSQSHNRARQL